MSNSVNDSMLNLSDYVYRVKCHSCDQKYDLSFGRRDIFNFEAFQQYMLDLKNARIFFRNCECCGDMTVNSLVAISKSDFPS